MASELSSTHRSDTGVSGRPFLNACQRSPSSNEMYAAVLRAGVEQSPAHGIFANGMDVVVGRNAVTIFVHDLP